MQVRTEELAGLPKLAYVATVRGASVEVLHGSAVEVTDRFVCDGVWAGDFAEGRFDELYLSGTGLIDLGATLRVVASSTPSDRVLIARRPDSIVLSNSLPLLLEVIDDALDVDDLFYRSRFMAADCGLSVAPRTVRTAGGQEIRTLLGEIADIAESGEISHRMRPLDPPFASFADYRAHLATTMEALIANASDEARTQRYAPLDSISSGYDSTATAVLCHEAGVTDYVTMLRYEGEGDDRRIVDYPTGLVDALGLEVDEVERGRWKDRTDFPDAEFAAGGTTFMDVVWLTLEDRLDGRLLFTGQYGDNVWVNDNFRIYDDISQGFQTYDARGFPEWRLRAGFAFVGVPSIAHTAQRSLFRISHSPEMAPWSVGGAYDRPIPRRLAEEGGVPRGSFAGRKFGGSGRVGTSKTSYTWGDRAQMMDDLTEVMTPTGAASFLDFCERVDPTRHERAMRVARLGHLLYTKCEAVNFRVGRRLHRYGIKGIVPRRAMALLAARYRLHLDYTYLWPHWGTEVLRARYRDALAAAGRTSA